MIQKTITPTGSVSHLVECYWYIAFERPPNAEKIIPDGFPEIIFHFGDRYEINIRGHWELQEQTLVAGQIRKHFFLRNKGTAKIFGIKLKPTALKHLFDINMSTLTDKVASCEIYKDTPLSALVSSVTRQSDSDQMADAADAFFKETQMGLQGSKVDQAVNRIFEKRGNIEIQDMCADLKISERQLERLFKEYIGLPPKFYARIIRFSNIFKMVNSGDSSWTDLAYGSGYYDQSHFIRNFKAFTGEDPSRYVFDDPTMANFFLKK